MGNTQSYERYRRQVILKEFGEEGQEKLWRAKVVVIGAGGLGCPALQYLAAAGVGTIGIVDDDAVSLDNLQRQVLYAASDIGLLKAETAALKLRGLNPEIKTIPYPQRLTTQNALTIIEAFDIVIDGTDNFSSRYMINDACVLMNKRLIYGAISQYEGQVAVFNGLDNKEAVNYRDIFPVAPREDEVLNCAEAGVLGVLPGIIGTMMANETIKLITGIGTPLINQLLTYNALTNDVYQLRLSARQETRSLIPADKAAFLQTNYEWLCAASSGSSPIEIKEIDGEDFDKLIASGEVTVIDVREKGEQPSANEFKNIQIPLTQLKEHLPGIAGEAILFFCQTGKRSLQAAMWAFDSVGATKKIYSLRGGILHWKKQRTKQAV